MNRNKIEMWIFSQEHCKHPNLIFGLTVLSSLVLLTIISIYIF